MYYTMYQAMYVKKSTVIMSVFTYFGIGMFFFGFFLRLTKSGALGSVGLPIEEQARASKIGTKELNQNNL